MTRVRTTVLLFLSFPVANNGLTLETAAVSRSGVEAFSRSRIRPPSLPPALSCAVMSRSLQSRRYSSFDRRSIVLRESRINDDRKKGGRGAKETKRQRRWPRKVFSKFLQRDGKAHHDTHEPLHATVDLATEDLLDALATDYSSSGQDFLLRNFETLSPSMVLPEVTKDAPTIDSEFFNVGIDHPADRTTRTASATASSPDSLRTTSNSGRNISLSRIVANALENILIGIINRRSLEPPVDLQVNAQSRGGVLNPLLRGKVNADAKIDVGRLVLPNIRMSGGTLEVKRMTMNVFGFCPQSFRLPSSRFPKQFDLHFQNMIFSREDLLDSSCIRNGLRRLLVRILRDRGVQASTVKVTSVNISPNGKVSCQGEAKTFIGSSHDFEVRTGLGISSRGHVLTFPGLEICLNRDLGFFVPVVPELDLDVGHNARFRHIEIDGRKKQIRLDASVTITPARTIRLNNYEQSAKAFSAKFHHDVGQWFTELLDFTV